MRLIRLSLETIYYALIELKNTILRHFYTKLWRSKYYNLSNNYTIHVLQIDGLDWKSELTTVMCHVGIRLGCNSVPKL